MFADRQEGPPSDGAADYRRLSNQEFFFIVLGALAIFATFAALGHSGRAFIAALAFGAVVGTAAIMRPLSNRVGYWVTLTVIALAHVLLIVLVKWPEIHGPGIILAPLVILDMYVSARLVRFFTRQY